jgi:Fibronectin type III domain
MLRIKAIDASGNAIKRRLTAVLMILVGSVWSIQAIAQSVTLRWDPNPAPNVAGYRVYCGTTGGVYTQQINVGAATATVMSNLSPGKTYVFVVTDYNVAGRESAPSNEVSYAVPNLTWTQTSAGLVNAVSRKTHGASGYFDINLPLTGSPGVECRTGGASGNHQVIVTFSDLVISSWATVTSGSGNVASSSHSGNQVTINLANVANGQTNTISLLGVQLKHSPIKYNISVPMAVLLGDTNGDRFVNSADSSKMKSQSGCGVTGSNFRQDLNLDGLINSADVSLVKSESGTALP